MKETTNTKVINIKAGTMLHQIGQLVESVAIIVKGSVLVYNDSSKIVCGPGSLLGINEINSDEYCYNYYTREDVSMLPLGVKNITELEEFLSDKSEYRSTIVCGLTALIKQVYNTYKELKKTVSDTKAFMNNTYRMLKEMANKNGIAVPNLSGIDKEIQENVSDGAELAKYYMDIDSLPSGIQNAFFNQSVNIAMHHVIEQLEIIDLLVEDCEIYATSLQDMFKIIIQTDGDCLYSIIAQVALDAQKLKINDSVLRMFLTQIKNKSEDVDKLLSSCANKQLSIDQEKIEQIYALFNDAAAARKEESEEVSSETTVRYAGADMENIEEEFNGSLDKILSFSDVDEEIKIQFRKDIVAFISLNDKNSGLDEVRALRKSISKGFYDIYEDVFKKSFRLKGEEIESYNIIELFLNYGFVDERLISKEQLIELYHIDIYGDSEGPCNVYSAKEWLEAIYMGEKEPSKNEFDLDYVETLREKKKNREITDEQMKEELENEDKKLSFEIKNMFRYNSRVVSGVTSIFVPVLYREQFMGHLDQSVISPAQLNDYIKKIVSIDYSLFYRERMIMLPGTMNNKEFVQIEVYPDIILLPVYGNNCVMWQCIEGKSRDTHARFLVPAFAENDIESSLVSACGRYRWEICRTEMGMNWNNLKYKSLTAEYYDYIQFYKKNSDLSDDKKNKIKVQIQKGRGNTKEVFSIDYNAWIRSESSGGMRLNKVARRILATYCPFTKNIRHELSDRPMFVEAMEIFNRNQRKKAHEIDLKYKSYESKNIELTPEMVKTREFYTSM